MFTRKKGCLHISIYLIFMALSAHAQQADNKDDLFNQLLLLESQMAIKITGMERIQNEERISSRGNLEQQLEQLLASYNHIVSRNAKGQIDHVVLLIKNKKRKLSVLFCPPLRKGIILWSQLPCQVMGGIGKH